jgi:serine protease Do
VVAEANTVGAQSAARPIGFSDVVAKVRSAVVGVRAQVEEQTQDEGGANSDDQDTPLPRSWPFHQFFNRGEPREALPHSRLETAFGSGFFISPDRYAVTNNHVVENGRKLDITTDDGKTYKARIIGVDQETDVALIKVDGRSDFPFVKFTDSNPQIGDWVLAVGSPFGLGGTVTAGIVSARGRDIGVSAYDDFIQIDAPINKGNSGGPTFDVDGRLTGVNTAILSPSGGSIGIAFDIPANTVKLVVQQLRDRGVVTRGWIGVQIQPITPEIADSLELKSLEGVLVAEPQANGPAALAGIESGDVISAVDGNSVKDAHDLAGRVATVSPGSSIEVGLSRGGEPKIIKVTVGRPANAAAHAESRDWQSQVVPSRRTEGLGLTVAPARAAGAGSDGVVVTKVDPSRKAAETDIQTGDVITAIGGQTVNTPDDVNRALANARDQARRSVLLRVKSNGQAHFVAMPVG